jgi:hypothetical protein
MKIMEFHMNMIGCQLSWSNPPQSAPLRTVRLSHHCFHIIQGDERQISGFAWSRFYGATVRLLGIGAAPS